MRVMVRNTLDLFLAAVAMIVSVALDVSLVSIFRSHVGQAMATSRYRPVYLHSGRRNRTRR